MDCGRDIEKVYTFWLKYILYILFVRFVTTVCLKQAVEGLCVNNVVNVKVFN